ncbi:uncharacterized protein LOC143301127 [Babylonia areolata]|uniref:uncharacterized protein LOC143301127 n=1 Tax=Babylonia areolata TaxID=304850 RepID=UPI003FD45C15
MGMTTSWGKETNDECPMAAIDRLCPGRQPVVQMAPSIHIKLNQDKVPDTEVEEQASTHSLYTPLQKARARWAGHVIRMSDSRPPKQLLCGELSQDKHSVGRQKKHFQRLPQSVPLRPQLGMACFGLPSLAEQGQ